MSGAIGQKRFCLDCYYEAAFSAGYPSNSCPYCKGDYDKKPTTRDNDAPCKNGGYGEKTVKKSIQLTKEDRIRQEGRPGIDRPAQPPTGLIGGSDSVVKVDAKKFMAEYPDSTANPLYEDMMGTRKAFIDGAKTSGATDSSMSVLQKSMDDAANKWESVYAKPKSPLPSVGGKMDQAN